MTVVDKSLTVKDRQIINDFPNQSKCRVKVPRWKKNYRKAKVETSQENISKHQMRNQRMYTFNNDRWLGSREGSKSDINGIVEFP